MGKKLYDYAAAATLQGLGERLLELVYAEGSAAQWDEWLRVPIELAVSTGCSELGSRLLDLRKSPRPNGGGGGGGGGGRGGRGLAAASPSAAWGQPDETAAAVAGDSIWGNPSTEDDDDDTAGNGGNVPRQQQQIVDKFSSTTPRSPAINARDASGNAPLHRAIAAGDVEGVSALLARGADTEMTDGEGLSPLLLAVGGRHLPIAVALLNAGADPMPMDGPNGMCSLMESASRAHHAEMLDVLVAHGTLADAPDADGNTAMHHAAMQGDTHAIDALVEVGADVGVKNPLDGSSPLHWAASKGKCEALLALLRHGADADANDDHGRTPLHDACSVDDVHEREAAELLLIWGADDTATDNNGFTASDYFGQIEGKRHQQKPPLLMDSSPAEKAWCRHGLSVVLCKARLGPQAVKAMLDRLVTMEEEELFERSWSANEGRCRAFPHEPPLLFLF